MSISFKTLVLSVCASGILAAAGCAISPTDGSDDPSSQQAASQPAAPPSEATQSSSLVPASSPAIPVADPGSGGATPSFELNPCACIDLSQICDCRSGTCYGYVQSGQDGPLYCYSGTTFLYKYYCPHYNQVRGC